jgi:hypothetical protein
LPTDVIIIYGGFFLKTLNIPLIIGTSLLVLSASTANAQVIVDNFASANGFGSGITSPTGTGNYLAQGFTNDSNSYSFVDVTVQVNVATTDPLEAAIYSNLAQEPGLDLSGFVSATPSGTGQQTLLFDHLAASLTGATKYFVVLRSSTNANSNFFWLHSDNGPTPNLGNGLIGTGANAQWTSSNFGNNWTSESGDFVGSESYILRVAGSTAGVTAPEPGTFALVLLGGCGLIARRRRSL